MGRIGRNVCDYSSIIRYSNLPVVGISPESFTIHTDYSNLTTRRRC
ncbi:Uncharacterized protein APZ42_004628 [Daphnia magna]|uniref:Uncharacterized protein n=1 Tax=Daphnia magna TaxID=35525 RepID=A0A164GXQ3_9CRUS|nr:Uncharacterized protein APZ42_004628 [Daphnia magna]